MYMTNQMFEHFPFGLNGNMFPNLWLVMYIIIRVFIRASRALGIIHNDKTRAAIKLITVLLINLLFIFLNRSFYKWHM